MKEDIVLTAGISNQLCGYLLWIKVASPTNSTASNMLARLTATSPSLVNIDPHVIEPYIYYKAEYVVVNLPYQAKG